MKATETNKFGVFWRVLWFKMFKWLYILRASDVAILEDCLRFAIENHPLFAEKYRWDRVDIGNQIYHIRYHNSLVVSDYLENRKKGKKDDN